jgi:hypothetical protein
MPKKPTVQDAQLILQLYHVRRDAEMRKARLWWRNKFWPQNAADYLKVEMALGTRETNWLRQVVSYWGMAASFVLQDTLSEKVFLDPAFSGEMFAVFSKVRPFLKNLRKRLQNPELLRNVEKVILRSSTGRARLKIISKRLAARRKTVVRPAKKPR